MGRELLAPCMSGDLSGDVCDIVLLSEGIRAEFDAIDLYESIADATDDEEIEEVMEDVSNEEKVHVGEFMALMGKNDVNFNRKVEEGGREVSEIT